MALGEIVSINNNYGVIATDAYGKDNEWIPFEITTDMIITQNEKEYIRYTDEVEFTLSRKQGIRDRDLREATAIKFIGTDWKLKERIFPKHRVRLIKNRLDKYCFDYPNYIEKKFEVWLKEQGIQSRMIEYLSPGIFTEEIPKHMDDTDLSFFENLLPWPPDLPKNCRRIKINKLSDLDGFFGF